jgi:hypothetical protein
MLSAWLNPDLLVGGEGFNAEAQRSTARQSRNRKGSSLFPMEQVFTLSVI